MPRWFSHFRKPCPASGLAPVPVNDRRSPDDQLASLLGRATVNLDTPELQRFLAGKAVLVTGAGGSIGSEICRQIMRFCPSRLALVERSENNLFEVDRQLRQTWVGARIIPYVADISDKVRVETIFAEQRPQVVLHCAAHKHVPLMEANPGEAIKNNIFGTKVVADAAVAHHAAAFVLISTDKAVNPTSVMGAAKRFAELYCQSLGGGHTRMASVRFGNVLASSGSVVPIFRQQITAGGPVTVTHPDMCRYFMTIPEASQLVLQAGAMGRGGEIFVLDMGQPIRILALARQMIAQAGLREGHDIAIEFTGIRPGEKLHEELAGVNEHTRPTAHRRIHVWQMAAADGAQVRAGLAILNEAIDADPHTAMQALSRCVPEYTPFGMRLAIAENERIVAA